MSLLDGVAVEFWLFQHEETGQTMHVDVCQVENGFEKSNPRLQKIRPIYNQSSLIREAQLLKSDNEKLKEAIAQISYCHYNNTGNEPSLSCFHRAIDEALELIKA